MALGVRLVLKDRKAAARSIRAITAKHGPRWGCFPDSWLFRNLWPMLSTWNRTIPNGYFQYLLSCKVNLGRCPAPERVFGTVCERWMLWGLGVVKHRVYVSAIEEEIWRVPRKNPHTETSVTSPCSWDPCNVSLQKQSLTTWWNLFLVVNWKLIGSISLRGSNYLSPSKSSGETY